MLSSNLKAFPQVEELEYRQKIDSNQLNTITNSLEESVLRAVLRGTEFSTYLDKLKLAVVKSTLAMNNRPNIGNIPVSPDENDNFISYATAYNTAIKMGTDVIGSKAIDVINGQVTLDYNDSVMYYKTPRTNELKATSSVKMIVDNVLRSYTDNCYDCLNKTGNSFWIEEVVSGDHTIEIQYPASSSSRFNYLKINPFPVYGFNITDVSYQNMNGEWIPLGKPLYTSDNEPITYHIAPVEYNGNIKISVTTLGNLDVIGFSLIDLAYVDYNSDSIVYIPIDGMDSTAGLFSYINISNFQLYHDMDISNELDIMQYISGVDIVQFNGSNPVSRGFVGEFTSFDESKTISATSNIINDCSTKFYLKLILKEYNRTTPVIKGAKITYTRITS